MLVLVLSFRLRPVDRQVEEMRRLTGFVSRRSVVVRAHGSGKICQSLEDASWERSP